jgi:hypothetical protein
MIIFRESGRLGNQIFQYAALRTLCQEGENLVLLGFEDLQAVFNGVNARVINQNSSRAERSFYHRVYKYLDSLSRKNIVTRVHESSTSSEEPEIVYGSALLNRIKFVDQSYFQYESSFNKEVISRLSIKKDLLVFAEEFLNTFHPSTPIFVHVRRGDYLNWPNSQEPAILSATYYRNCLDIIQATVPNPFFVFMSNDPYYVKDIFGELKNSFISRFSGFEDFVIMTQCQGGILSASSFSWWAAYFANLQHPDSTFLAPRYWAGHRSGTWFPPFIQSSFLNYVDA